MRTMLATSRRAGLAFEMAWDAAWKRVRWPHDTEHRIQWKDRLIEDLREWHDAYDLEGKHKRPLVALGMLLEAAASEALDG